ncbi:Protein SMG5 like protein [Argiope bruennichi]|uniref:Protein SMG5 like protein n=1 Tax=Argiope bruennichi TaxID=94029 RepID=A0A8T0E1Q1_ARGBR|nr:Protein SMG5 like protein [Argiope bruennichi]
MKSTVTKEIVKFGNDASRRLYRGATEAARKLETRLGQGSNLTELFSSEITELRMRLKDYCERLIFADPVEYGKKAEDLLWRKVFYDFFWRCKQNRRKLLESEYHRNAFRSHLLAGIGFYHHLLLRIQTEFHLNLEGKVDVPLLWHLKGVKKERWKKYQLSAASDENVQTWADQASHRILIYLGDLERYIAELDEPESNHLAERYYQQAFCLNSQNGTPHNQLGSLYSNRFDSAYHYMRCLSSRERFEGADNNLVRLFEKNEEVIKQLYSSDCVEKKSLKCTRFLSRFLKLCQMFYFKPSENYNAQTYCQDILKEFGITRSASTYENDSETEDIDAWLSEDIIFKVVVMSLLCVWKSQEKGPTYASVAISFSFAFFSYVVQRVTRQLSIAILDLKPTESLQNGCIIENEKNLSKQLTLSISKEQLDDTSEENEINKDLLLKKMSGKKSSLKKFSARRLHRLRRRRKLSSTSQDDSELSDGEMSDLPESDEESGLLNSDVSCSSESDDEDENIIEENGLSIDGELDANLDNNLILTNGISKNLSDDNAKENHDESDKNSSIDVNSVLGNPTIAPEKFVHILRKIKLLPCLKILTDWLRINENILSAGAVTSPYLLSCLIELLNILLKIEDKLSNDRFQRLLKNDETVIQDYPLPEDTVLQSFPILKDIHSKLSFDVSKRRALSTSEQVYLRFKGIYKEEGKFGSVKTANRDAESQKHYLMRSMAHLWLKAEVDDLETFVEGQASRQLSPILVTDASVLCCNLPAIKQLVNTKKFIVVVPLVGKPSGRTNFSETVIYWETWTTLYDPLYIFIYVKSYELALISNGRSFMLLLHSFLLHRDFYQVLECCNYLVQQQTNGKSNCHLVTLLVGSFHHLPDNAIAIAQSIDVTIEKIGSFFAKWRTSLKKPG